MLRFILIGTLSADVQRVCSTRTPGLLKRSHRLSVIGQPSFDTNQTCAQKDATLDQWIMSPLIRIHKIQVIKNLQITPEALECLHVEGPGPGSSYRGLADTSSACETGESGWFKVPGSQLKEKLIQGFEP